jgi:hypothetical protein
MNKEINNHGYDYVDLELPSGTLWATCNVGADIPSDYGLYFQWGETYGYTADQVGKDKQFNWSDYKFSIDGSFSNFSKYTTDGESLELEDDAAHVNMGGDWHMPTHTQCQELIDNTTTAWTTQDGVNGKLFTSKKNGKSIFIPAAGVAWDGSVYNRGDCGSVWSSMLSTGYVYCGQDLFFNSFDAYLSHLNRGGGLSVRGVIDKKDNISNRKKNNTEMNKNLNLVDILKDAPKGTKLWSPICGDCILDKIYTRGTTINYAIHCLTVNDHTPVQFAANGKYTLCFDDGECVLFPSKENHDWSTFKVPNKHKHFEPYQKVLVKVWTDSKTHRWVPVNYGYYDASKNMHFLSNFTFVEDCGIIPYEGNENKLGTIAK